VSIDKSRLKLAAVYAVAALAIGAWGVKFHVDDLRPGLKIKSAPYRWSAACSHHFGLGNGEIIGTCARPEYSIDDTKRAGLSDRYRSTRWYRIGDDAYKLSCMQWTNFCLVDAIVRRRFVR
jgi:hypothetical protein